MRIYKVFRTALHALRRNVMRSVLTTLGIIIGIAAVIAMMEIGNGVSTMNSRAIASLGANNLMVRPGSAATGGFNYGAGSNMALTPQDADAILRDCPMIRAAAPVVGASAQAIYAGKNYNPQTITGTTPMYLDVRDWPLDEGACFTDQDVRSLAKVCIIGHTIQQELFGNEDPLGKELRLGSVNLRIVGILSRKGASTFGSDQDDVIIAPWTTVKFRVSGSSSSSSSGGGGGGGGINSLSNPYPTSTLQLYPSPSQMQAADMPAPIRFVTVSQILTAAVSAEDITPAINEMTDLLRERHRIHPEQPEDFTIRDMTELMNTLTSVQTLFGRLLLIVAAISLVVGGVGIMNIMLVSVTERTREIGLRMAVGARSRDILRQFLVEAVLLCLSGGIIGICLGRGASALVRYFANWPTQASIPAIVISVIVSASVGIVFGFYPAWKASRLDPIEALRYE